jgi:hypothetical protein
LGFPTGWSFHHAQGLSATCQLGTSSSFSGAVARERRRIISLVNWAPSNAAHSNVISMNPVIANAIEKSKLGEASFVKHDIFSSPALVDKVCSDDILSPLYDVPSYNDMFEEYALRNSCSLACDDTKPLVYDGYDDEYNIFSSPTIENKISYDYKMPPIYDDYGDENNYSIESAPITIVPVVSINSFMHVARDRDVLCESYIVSSIHDATKSYYERGKHGLMDLNNIKFPLFMLQILKWHLFYLSMLATICLVDFFSYKIPMHRKWFRYKCLSYLLFDALFCFKFLYGAFASSSYMAPT